MNFSCVWRRPEFPSRCNRVADAATTTKYPHYLPNEELGYRHVFLLRSTHAAQIYTHSLSRRFDIAASHESRPTSSKRFAETRHRTWHLESSPVAHCFFEPCRPQSQTLLWSTHIYPKIRGNIFFLLPASTYLLKMQQER